MAEKGEFLAFLNAVCIILLILSYIYIRIPKESENVSNHMSVPMLLEA